MVNGQTKPTAFPQMKRVRQETSSHCGPAVLEMLLSIYGIDIEQDRFVMASGVDSERLESHGMLIEELGTAVNRLLPQLRFWYKMNSSLDDLVQLSKVFEVPVGVEWQGVFEEDEDDDNGHYSVVTEADVKNNLMRIADPYGRYAGKDRSFTLSFFMERWWDTNDITDPLTGMVRKVEDYRVSFVVVPEESDFPAELGMKVVS